MTHPIAVFPFRRALLALVCVLATTATGRCALEFSGYLQSPQGLRFVLTDTTAKESSALLQMGQTFAAHTLMEFEPQSEVLTVKRGDTIIRLPLTGPRFDRTDTTKADLARQLSAARDVVEQMRKRYRDAHPDLRDQLLRVAELERQLAR